MENETQCQRSNSYERNNIEIVGSAVLCRPVQRLNLDNRNTSENVVLGPRQTPRQTGRLTVGRNIILTFFKPVSHTEMTKPRPSDHLLLHSLIKSERLSSHIKLTLHKALIR
jgi:hypothetical protein